MREFSNSFTKSKRTIESFLFHAFQDFQKRGGERRGKIEGLNLSQRFTGIE